jgi:hypothetical protein
MTGEAELQAGDGVLLNGIMFECERIYDDDDGANVNYET